MCLNLFRNATAQMPREYYNKSINSGYYNWFSATAESGLYDYGTSDLIKAGDSICPKGWQLPEGEKSSITSNISWLNLFGRSYGLTNDGASEQIIRKSPLSFTRFGYYYWGDGRISSFGLEGDYWTSKTADGTGMTALNFEYTSSSLQFQEGRSSSKVYGFTLRCIKK